MQIDKLVIAAGKRKQEGEYWENKLSEGYPVTRIPYDNNKDNGVISYNKIEFTIDNPYLIQLSGNSDNRLYVILLASVFVFLKKYLDTDIITLGSPIIAQEENENLINTILPLRINLHDEDVFSGCLAKTKETVIEATKNQNYPLELLAKKYSTDLFDIAVLLENVQKPEYLSKVASNIIFSFARDNNDIRILLKYNSNLFIKSRIENIAVCFNFLLNQISADNSRIKDLKLISEVTKKEILDKFNCTEVQYPTEKSIYEIIEDSIRETPYKIAVKQKDLNLSYSELNTLALKVAVQLREIGVGNNTLVGIFSNRSIELVIIVLGILKAGGCFLPLNIADPKQRINYILKQSSCELLLYENEKDISEINCYKKQIFSLISNARKGIAGQELSNYVSNDLNKIAYIIYTSGTTGNPKGVIIPQNSLVNYIHWAKKMYLNEKSPVKMPFFTSFSFDLSLTSLFLPLSTSGTVVVYEKDPAKVLKKILLHDQCEIVKLTPSHLRLLREILYNENWLLQPNNFLKKKIGLKGFIVGGEQFETKLAQDLIQMFDSDVALYNEYGPTEATIGCMIYKYEPSDNARFSVPIGIPIYNTQIYLLNKQNEPVLDGVHGEIYIGGNGLAMGYVNDPTLTENKFINSPFRLDSRLYKTGDTGVRLDNHKIEYIGRIDNQVKIRGYRIEIGEIENLLLAFPKISNAAVVIKTDLYGDKSLLVYYVSNCDLDVLELKKYLLDKLPAYMVPGSFIRLSKMPLNENGKVNIKLLPDPNNNASNDPPVSGTEKKLVSIWSKILGKSENNIGINTSFFSLGGNSIKALSLMSKIFLEFKIKVPLSDIFDKNTIKELSKILTSDRSVSNMSFPKAEKREYYALSSAQKRLYYIHQLYPNNINYNIPLIVTLKGTIDVKKIETAFTVLIKRHEILHSSYRIVNQNPVQFIRNDYSINIEWYKSKREEANKIIGNFIRPFDLISGSLLRIGIIQLHSDEHIFMMDMHHIISDAVSDKIFFDEFLTLFNSSGKNELPRMEYQYKDYAEWQHRYRYSQKMMRQQEYWLSVLNEEISKLKLTPDFPRPETEKFDGEDIIFLIDNEIFLRLRELQNETQTTSYIFLLAVCNFLLSKYSGQEDIIIGSPISGRHFPAFNNLIGMFIGQIAIRNRPRKNITFSDFLAEVKDHCIKAFDNQDYPFDELISKLHASGNSKVNSLFDVVFAVFNIDSSYETFKIKVTDPKIEVLPYNYKNRMAKTDLRFEAREFYDRIVMKITYNIHLYKRTTCELMASRFLQILKMVIENPNIRLQDISFSQEFALADTLYFQTAEDFNF